MATVPSTATKAVNDPITAAWANNNVKTPIDWDFTGKPIFYAVQAVAQTGWTTSTFTAITFTTEVLDRGAQHSTSSNTSRVVIGGTLGYYRISGTFGAAGNSAATLLRASIGLNGTRVASGMSTISPGGVASAVSVTTPTVIVQATSSSDYIELFGYVTAASGTLGTSVSADFGSSLTVEWIGS